MKYIRYKDKIYEVKPGEWLKVDDIDEVELVDIPELPSPRLVRGYNRGRLEKLAWGFYFAFLGVAMLAIGVAGLVFIGVIISDLMGKL